MSEKDKHHSKKRGREITRREFLGLSMRTTFAAGAVVIGVPAAYYIFDRSREGSEIDRAIKEEQEKEKILEPTILEFENGFEDFESLVVEKFELPDLPEKERQFLSIPFELARINRQNPDRNIHLWRRKYLETRRSLSGGTVEVQNQYFFFFDLLNGKQNVGASFTPMTRAFNINLDYDPKNVFDNLIAFHELVHVAQDIQDRQEIPYKTYEEFFNDAQKRKKVKVIGLYEATAYVAQIYLLNLLSDGQFKEDSIARQVDPVKYRKTLHLRPEQDNLISLLGRMASIFYGGKSTLEMLDASFLSYINNFHRQQGMEVYERVPNGYILSRL